MTLTNVQTTIFAIVSSILLLSGCIKIGDDKPAVDIPDITIPSIKIPEFIGNATDRVKQYFDEGISAITNDVSNAVDVIDNNIKKVLEELNHYIDSIPDKYKIIIPEDIGIVNGIAKLETIDNTTLGNSQGYKEFADNVNTILEFINREGGLDIEHLKGTTDEYKEVSKLITRLTPLVDNYNALVLSAKAYDENDPESIRAYYKALGLFCLEVGLIYSHVWYKTSYAVVGKVYRVSGLNRLAFKCPTLISAILGKAHWGLRNYLTNKTTETVGIIVMGLPQNVTTDISNRLSN